MSERSCGHPLFTVPAERGGRLLAETETQSPPNWNGPNSTPAEDQGSSRPCRASADGAVSPATSVSLKSIRRSRRSCQSSRCPESGDRAAVPATVSPLVRGRPRRGRASRVPEPARLRGMAEGNAARRPPRSGRPVFGDRPSFVILRAAPEGWRRQGISRDRRGDGRKGEGIGRDALAWPRLRTRVGPWSVVQAGEIVRVVSESSQTASFPEPTFLEAQTPGR